MVEILNRSYPLVTISIANQAKLQCRNYRYWMIVSRGTIFDDPGQKASDQTLPADLHGPPVVALLPDPL